MDGEPVIPAPDADDDDDVAWALQTAAIQWQRGQRADAVVWLRRAVDASISAGRSERTRVLTRLAAGVAARLVSEALAVPDSGAPPRMPDKHESDVDELLARPTSAPKSIPPRAAAQSMSDIPVEFDDDDAELIEDDLEDDLDDDLDDDDVDDDGTPTLPPPDPLRPLGFRHELTSREYEYEPQMGDPDYDGPGSLRARAPVDEDSDYVEEGETESIVDVSELLSDSPRGSASLRAGSSQSSQSNRAAQSGRPAQSSQSGRPAQSSQSGRPAQSDRASSSEKPKPAGGTAPPAERRAESSRSPSASNRPANTGWTSPPSARNPGNSDRSPSSSQRPRPSSDRPIEPIVTAEELFRDRALAGSSRPPPSSGGAVPVPEPLRAAAPPKPQQDDRSAAPPAAPAPAPAQPIVDEIALDQVRGFEDLPEASQLALAASAVLTNLSTDEEVGTFAAALVTRGRVGIMPSIADVASSVAKAGEIVFTRGTLGEGVALRVVALERETVVASWTEAALTKAMADCPWVEAELRLIADRFQAMAGAVLGRIGERLDETLRDIVLSRLDVKTFGPGELIVEEGKPVPGLHVVGGGRVEIVSNGGGVEEAAPGEFLFAAEVLGAGRAHGTARAGRTGALILFAPRSVAHELLLSVPPMIEMLSD